MMNIYDDTDTTTAKVRKLTNCFALSKMLIIVIIIILTLRLLLIIIITVGSKFQNKLKSYPIKL